MIRSIQTLWSRQKAAFAAVVAILTVNVTLYFGCAGGVNLYSKSDDMELGRQIQAEIAHDPANYPVLNNASVRNYVQGIVNKVVSSPAIQNKDFNYVVTVINDDKTVNAFAIPGGPIYVYTGLMKYIDNEATLAGVLGHEITHSDHRHATRRMSEVYGLQIIASIALGQNPGTLAQIAAGLAGNLAVLKFSRDDERDADKGSFDALYSLPGQPWYPAAIKYFMQKTLADAKSQPSALENLFATHPPSQERLDNINKMASDAHLPAPTQQQLNPQTYASYRSLVP